MLWKNGLCRIVLASESDYRGLCRVIVGRHVREMTDLSGEERGRLMAVVFATEAVLRDILAPDKINLASLGNVVPHLHWHVIPRYRDDRHFPGAIWAQPARAGTQRPAPDPQRLARALGTILA